MVTSNTVTDEQWELKCLRNRVVGLQRDKDTVLEDNQRLREENAKLRGLLGKTVEEMLGTYERYRREDK